MLGRKDLSPGKRIKNFRQARTFRILVLTLLLILQLIIFMPHIGKGFIADDLVWIDSVVHSGKIDLLSPFKETTGFFRPLVAWTFGIQYKIHGLNPRPFGLFNLFLHMLNIIMVYLLLSSHEKSKPYAIFAALLFALNAKGVQHAVGWISGRTSLMFTFFLLLSLYSYVKINKNPTLKLFLTGFFYFAALLSKETALVTPIFVLAVSYLDLLPTRERADVSMRLKGGLRTAAVFILPLLPYFILRFNSNAMTPFNAPACYAYTLSPLWLLENVCEYTIRAGLLDIYILILLLLILLIPLLRKKVNKEKSTDKSTLFMGLLWFLIFILPVLPLPTRSDLYVYFPQIGLHTASLAIICPLWKRLNINNRLKRLVICTLIFMMLTTWLGYLINKAETTARKGMCSTAFTQQVVQAFTTMEPGTRIFIIDKHFQEDFSPSRIVFYGFSSLLNIHFPDKHLWGRIISPSQLLEIEKIPGNTRCYTWENGHLKLLSK